jgi:hypothetical protein
MHPSSADGDRDIGETDPFFKFKVKGRALELFHNNACLYIYILQVERGEEGEKE